VKNQKKKRTDNEKERNSLPPSKPAVGFGTGNREAPNITVSPPSVSSSAGKGLPKRENFIGGEIIKETEKTRLS